MESSPLEGRDTEGAPTDMESYRIGNAFLVWEPKPAHASAAVAASESSAAPYQAVPSQAVHQRRVFHVAAGSGAGRPPAVLGDAEPLMICLPLSALREAARASDPFRLPHFQRPDRVRESVLEELVSFLEARRLVGPQAERPPHPMAQAIGPMLTTSRAVTATKSSRQNLAAQAKKRRLIRLASSEGTQWWPTFQFRRVGDRAVPHPGVQALWGLLPAGTVTDWDHAVWMCSPRHDLDGDSPLDLAIDEEAVDRDPLRSVVDAYVHRLTR